MSGAKIIEEISQFYDIKQRINENGDIYYYITHCDINIYAGIKYSNGGYCISDDKTLRVDIDRIILLIDKINEIFEFTYVCDKYKEDYDMICIGNVEIYFQFKSYICIKNYTFEKIYYNVYDLIEYLKQNCPECIKSTDIKIALK